VRLADQPVREQAAAAAASDADALLVDVAALHYRVDAGEQILRVVAGEAVLDHVRELEPVARAAARIRVEHAVAGARERMELVEEPGAVRGVRTAVDLEHQRIFSRGVEIRRLHDPALDLATVERVVPELLDVARRPRREQLVVRAPELLERAGFGI